MRSQHAYKEISIAALSGELDIHKGDFLQRCDVFGEKIGDAVMVVTGVTEQEKALDDE